MVDRLRSLREPFVVVLLLALVGRLVVPVVEAIQSRRAGGDLSTQALSFVPYGATDPLMLVVLTVLLGSCLWSAPTRHGRVLVVTALVVAAAGTGASLVAAVALLGGGLGSLVWVDTARLVLNLVLPVLAVVSLTRLAVLSGRVASAGPAVVEPAVAGSAPSAEIEPRRDPAQEPTWQPDQAAGAAWLKAGDAAAGAAATGWGAPDHADGWAPARPPRDPSGSEATGGASGSDPRP